MTIVRSTADAVHSPIHDKSAGPDEASERQVRETRTAQVVEALRACACEAEERGLREQLIAVNMPLAAGLARRYRNRGESEDDLEQVAFLGLTQAARRFDPNAGAPFVAFCVPTVLGELRRHFRDRGWVVRPPRGLQELHLLVLRAQTELASMLGRSPTVAEIADHAGHDFDDVEEALALSSCYSPTSLDRPASCGEDSCSLGELIPVWDDQQRAAEARVVLAPAMVELSGREKQILQLRFFDGMTQREIGESVGITQMQVSRVLMRIFSDLRGIIGAAN